MVAGRGDLSDLSAQLRRQRRRWRRRPGRDHRAPGLRSLARGRRGLALAVLHLADEGLRLRCQRLHRRRSAVWNPRGLRRPDRPGPWPRPQGDHRPGLFAHLRQASLVRGERGGARRSAGRLVRLGRRQARWVAAEQLAGCLRRRVVDLEREAEAVLSAQLPGRTAGSQFLVTAGPGRDPGGGGVLARPRGRRLPPRCHRFSVSRQRAAR